MSSRPVSRFGVQPPISQGQLPLAQSNILEVTCLSEGARGVEGGGPEYLLVSSVQEWIHSKSSKKKRLLSSLNPATSQGQSFYKKTYLTIVATLLVSSISGILDWCFLVDLAGLRCMVYYYA